MNIREKLKDSYIIFDGAFGTYYAELTKSSEIPELANVTDSETVKKIHTDYIEAGANVIRTNTFASNVNTLCKGGDYGRVKENINLAVTHARAAVKESGRDVLIAGDIGPLKNGSDLNEYKLIADTLVDSGVDLLVFETFSDIEDILPAVEYIKGKNKDIFVIVQFCINQFGYTNVGLSGENLLERAIANEFIDAAGFNCGVGPGHMYSLMKNMKISGDTYITALPNASYPKIIKDRMVFMKNEAYFLDKIKEIAGLGVDFIGGCCGTRPDYIRLLAEYARETAKSRRISVTSSEDIRDIKVTDNSFYKQKEKEKKPLMAVELSPPLDADYKKIMDAANSLKNCDVDVLTFPDSPSGRTRADSILMAAKVAAQTGMCVMPHICCRDKNAIAIRSQLLGAQINDITNFLVITGDPVSTLMRQDVKSVFNFDSCGLMKLMKDMNEDKFISRPLTYGGAINYSRKNLDFEIKRVKKKMELGATFFFTQPVFCSEDMDKVKSIKRETGARILCGIMPLVSRRNALFIKNEMAGIHVTDEVIAMYDGVADKSAGEEVGVAIAANMMKLAETFADGFYFSIPFNRVYLVERILKKIKERD